jgi:hypothetical protein
MTPSLKRTRPEPECRFTPRAMTLRTQVSTSASVNSAEKERSRQLGHGYLHFVNSSPEWLDTAADEGTEDVHSCQPISDETLEDASHEL